MSKECLKGIFYKTKESKTFLKNITISTYGGEDLAKMLAHLCFENKDYSLRIAKHILKGKKNCKFEELGTFLEIMK